MIRRVEQRTRDRRHKAPRRRPPCSGTPRPRAAHCARPSAARDDGDRLRRFEEGRIGLGPGRAPARDIALHARRRLALSSADCRGTAARRRRSAFASRRGARRRASRTRPRHSRRARWHGSRLRLLLRRVHPHGGKTDDAALLPEGRVFGERGRGQQRGDGAPDRVTKQNGHQTWPPARFRFGSPKPVEAWLPVVSSHGYADEPYTNLPS